MTLMNRVCANKSVMAGRLVRLDVGRLLPSIFFVISQRVLV